LTDKACTQITDTTDKSYFGNHSTAFLNADGTHVAFRSEANLTGNNADGNWEIILLDVITNTLTQIAGTIGSDNSGLSITAGGARIAFVSTADQTGRNLYHQMAFFLADCPPAPTPTPAVGPNTEVLKPLKVKSGSRLATAGTGLIT
jgi:Tol biopolymer transport system component